MSPFDCKWISGSSRRSGGQEPGSRDHYAIPWGTLLFVRPGSPSHSAPVPPPVSWHFLCPQHNTVPHVILPYESIPRQASRCSCLLTRVSEGSHVGGVLGGSGCGTMGHLHLVPPSRHRCVYNCELVSTFASPARIDPCHQVFSSSTDTSTGDNLFSLLLVDP